MEREESEGHPGQPFAALCLVARPSRPRTPLPNPFPSSSWTPPTSRVSQQSINAAGFLVRTLKLVPDSLPHGLEIENTTVDEARASDNPA